MFVLKASEQAFLQNSQDLLADFAGIPICLFQWDEIRKRLDSKIELRFSIFDKELIAPHYWSYNPTFFRLLEREPKLSASFNSYFQDSVRKCGEDLKRNKRKPVIFKDDLDHWFFIAPVTTLKEEESSLRREPAFILCGGPIHITQNPYTWRAFQAELTHLEQDSILGRSFQLQLACEFLELPTRPSEEALREEARNLQYTFNGIVRDLLPRTSDNRLDYHFGRGLETVLYELFRHVRNSDLYLSALKILAERLSPHVPAIAVAFRNPASGTGFLALHVPGEEDEDLAEQLLFIPKPSDAETVCSAQSWDEMPEEDIRHLIFPSNVNFLETVDMPFPKRADAPKARVLIWFDERRMAPRIIKRSRSLIDPFLQGFAVSWEITADRVRLRASQAEHNQLAHKRGAFTHAVTAFAPMVQEGLTGEDLESILETAQSIIGFDRAVYYHPCLYEREPFAEPFASVGYEEQPDKRPISREIFNNLFRKLQPLASQSTVFFPVVMGNRCVAILEFAFANESLKEQAMMLMAEFTNQLSLRVPYRRLIELLRELTTGLDSDSEDHSRGLAQRFAYLFSECACSIWTYDERAQMFELIDREGVNLSLGRKIRWNEAYGTVIRRCIERESTQVVNIDEDVVRSKEELLDEGFKQGVAVPSNADHQWLIIVFWSKVEFAKSYFSPDDIAILRFTSFVLLQLIRLRSLLKEQEVVHDRLITGLGHELRAPLTNLSENIKRLERGENSHLAKDLVMIADYAVALVESLSLFAEIEKPAPVTKDEERQIYPLFEGIIYRVENILRWQAQRKGVKVELEFDPTEFPPGVRLSREENDYLFSIIFNLLSNTIRYTYENELRPIRVIGELEHSWVTIRVQNYGINVLEGEEEMIFERQTRGSNAWRGSPTGGGLGLYISRKLVERLMGKLELTRRANPTEFTLSLPVKLCVAPWEVRRGG